MKKILIIFIIIFPTNLFSFEKTTNFTFKKFNDAQNSGKTIVVNSWNKNCMTCSQQFKILSKAKKDFNNVEFLFYEQTKHKNIAESLNIKFWSTIAIYKGKLEIAREIGLIKKEDIYTIIKKGV